jgi:sodium-dependent phosphate transporter
MEMGAAITVLVFSQYSLPVSTSMCITGATVGVGLCNGSLKAVNFHRVGLLMSKSSFLAACLFNVLC